MNKLCNNNHPLFFSQGFQRNFPQCNGCGTKQLQTSYCCSQCNFDLCANCYSSNFGNVSSNVSVTSNFGNFGSNQQFGNFGSSGMTNQFQSFQTNTPLDTLHNDTILDQNKYIVSKNGKYYARMQDDGNFVCYTGTNFNSNFAFWASNSYGKGTGPYHLAMQKDGNLVVYDRNRQPTWASDTWNKGTAPFKLVMQDDRNLCIYDRNNTATWASNTYDNNYNQSQSQSTSQNMSYPTFNTNQQTNFSQQSNFNQNQQSNFGQQSNFVQQSNYGSNSGMTKQIQAVEYKQCPSKHYLTLCDSTTRSYPSCNICNTSRLKHSWTCFTCDYDMCLACYDLNNNKPTKNIKVCNKRHLLVYTDLNQRKNVKCDKCGKQRMTHQYTCWVCNYDECQSCYEGRTGNTNCNIF